MVNVPLATTQVLPLPGARVQLPMMEPLLSVLPFVFTVPVTDELVRVTTSPAALVMVNENVPVTWSAEL